jgi:hypothetical protein
VLLGMTVARGEQADPRIEMITSGRMIWIGLEFVVISVTLLSCFSIGCQRLHLREWYQCRSGCQFESETVNQNNSRS